MNRRDLGLSMAPDFQLFIPSSYGNYLDASGPVERQEEWAPSRLPRWVTELKFTFRRIPRSDQEVVQNLYHYGDFFIASESMKDFLISSTNGEAEVARVDVRHDDGKPADETYFAVKILRTIDCIDLKKSMANRGYTGDDPVSFEESLISLRLAPEIAPEFANAEDMRYASCPDWTRTKSIALIESRIPADAVLFQPALWPGHLITTSDFAAELEGRCSGGTLGYYFWTLSLSDPGGSHHRLMIDMR
jgi:hypothetical protein